MRPSALVVVAFLCTSLPGAVRPDDPEEIPGTTAPEATDATPFGTVVARAWAGWSAGRDSLSRDDLIAALGRPEIRGEDAAALAALERWSFKNGPATRDAAVAIDDPKTLKRYRVGVAALRAVNRKLFASGGPNFSQMQQGPAGDCYLFSGAGWTARYRPEVIVRAIAPLPDGSYRVTFPNGDGATVTPPTDGELAVNDSASTLRDGLWMPILEKATGVIMASRGGKSAAIPDPTVAVDVPSGPKPVVERFTGRRAATFHLGAKAHRGKVREALVRMASRRLMAEVLILHRPPALSIPWDHVYAVLDFEPATDTVVLWNPWGTDFHPQGPSGPENGYERVHGVFRIPFEQFVSFFSFLAVEES
ncbi:MAG: hypothetical protein WCK73_04275 [Deltaproteobacteria bacterium]